MDQLSGFQHKISDCKACPLGETRTNLVFGTGDPQAEILFIGEAPGYHEDRQGVPFVGAAGQLLNRLLATIGFNRGQVYIANVLKCRPPNNRDPLPEEIELCRPHLEEQIRIINPKVICTLGRFAASFVLDRSVSMGAVHGRPVVQNKTGGGSITVFPLHHPAAALHQPATIGVLEEDFRRLAALLSEIQAAERELEPKLDPEPVLVTEQMGLF